MRSNRQQGVALIAAIFLVVIIGAAVTLLSVLSARNSQISTQSLLLLRANMAASAAIEATIQAIVTNPSTSACSAAPAVGSSVIAIPLYSGYQATVTCQSLPYNRPSQTITLYNIVARVEYGQPSNTDYVWTELTASVEM